MLLYTNSHETTESAQRALVVINSLRHRNTLPIRPNTEDSPWVKTAWPNEAYL